MWEIASFLFTDPPLSTHTNTHRCKKKLTLDFFTTRSQSDSQAGDEKRKIRVGNLQMGDAVFDLYR